MTFWKICGNIKYKYVHENLLWYIKFTDEWKYVYFKSVGKLSSKVFLYFVKHTQKHTQFIRNKEKFNFVSSSIFPTNLQAHKLR